LGRREEQLRAKKKAIREGHGRQTLEWWKRKRRLRLEGEAGSAKKTCGKNFKQRGTPSLWGGGERKRKTQWGRTKKKRRRWGGSQGRHDGRLNQDKRFKGA